jgi:hypothetical protein
MAEMARYSKAYMANRFSEYSGWEPNLQNLRKEKKTEGGEEIEVERTELCDNDVLYLQDNYVVTHGIMKDENVIFSKVDDDWKKFCGEVLKFEIPTFVDPAEMKLSESEKSSS